MNIYKIIPISDKIIDSFRPTRLYIKELAGKKYFGKSVVNDITAYTGSGKIWKDRIKKYGKGQIKTLWVSDWFYCPYHIQQFALMFSEYNQIVESDEWANYKPENGLDGGSFGSRSKRTKEKIRNALRGKPKSEEHKHNMFKPMSSPEVVAARRGKGYDRTIYCFEHKITKEKLMLTQLEFIKKFNASKGNVSALVAGKPGFRSVFGWALVSKPSTV